MREGSSAVDRIAIAAFILGLILLAFGYGFVAGANRLFPHRQMMQAEEAAEAVYKVYLQPESRATGELRSAPGTSARVPSPMTPPAPSRA